MNEENIKDLDMKLTRKINWKLVWPHFIVLLLGVILTGKQLEAWYVTSSMKYTIIEFETLKVSEGILSFRPIWKSSGGEIVLTTKDNQKITLTCAPPGGLGGGCYFNSYRSVDYRKTLVGKQVKIWWQPIHNELDQVASGRVYQLETDGKYFYDYRESADYYKNHLPDRNASDHLFFAICYLVILIFIPIKTILKARKS